jgi:hypothetical protein
MQELWGVTREVIDLEHLPEQSVGLTTTTEVSDMTRNERSFDATS